jgi:hypothetical protein
LKTLGFGSVIRVADSGGSPAYSARDPDGVPIALSEASAVIGFPFGSSIPEE